MGGTEVGALVSMEPTLKYHPDESEILTEASYPGPGHCLVGSLTGAVASETVTESRDGSLSLIGNQASSAMA